MTAEAPILCTWDGEAFVPLNQAQAKLCDRDYVVHERYRMAPVQDRSWRSHAHYFASINEAWQNLPDNAAERFPTSEHLRKWCLIKAGYRDERSIVCSSKAEAQRVAAFVRPMDDYAVVIAREAVVMVFTAKSQSMRAMGKKDFQASKDAVLQIISDMIQVEPAKLQENAGKAA